MRSDGRRLPYHVLVGHNDQASCNSSSYLQRLAGGPCGFAHLSYKIERRMHGAFGIILVSLGITEERQSFVPRGTGNASPHIRDNGRARVLETVDDASEVLGVDV